MKYNIVTITNQSYVKFLNLFIKTLNNSVDPERINKIFIFDTGLETYSKTNYEIDEKIQFIKTPYNSKMINLHDKGWQESTYFKTSALFYVLKTYNSPTILFDCDMVFVRDFFYLLDESFDIGVCKTNQSNITKYLGSFFVAKNVEKSKKFVSLWINQMKENNELPKESPSLVNTVIKSKNIKFKKFDESCISSLYPNENAHIYHLKSGGLLRSVESRLNQAHILPFL
jgi:hypothetical protein